MPLEIAGPQILLRPLSALVAYERNARTHSADQVERIVASLREFGWTNPMLVDGDSIVAGHGRSAAAAQIYAAGETIRFPNGTEIPAGLVPVIDCAGWSDEQRRAYVLADNAVALKAGWDGELLRLELEDLRDADFDLALTGFDQEEIDAALAAGTERPPAEAPDEFKAFGDDLPTEYCCPKCGYAWSGKANAGGGDE